MSGDRKKTLTASVDTFVAKFFQSPVLSDTTRVMLYVMGPPTLGYIGSTPRNRLTGHSVLPHLPAALLLVRCWCFKPLTQKARVGVFVPRQRRVRRGFRHDGTADRHQLPAEICGAYAVARNDLQGQSAPCSSFTCQAINTFIDDIFAFVIKMPTLHRVGCFRDGWGIIVRRSCRKMLFS
jgi:hypothetical protein